MNRYVELKKYFDQLDPKIITDEVNKYNPITDREYIKRISAVATGELEMFERHMEKLRYIKNYIKEYIGE